MKKKFKFLIFCCFLMPGIQQLQARELDSLLVNSIEEKVQVICDRMERELSLSNSQVEKIKVLLDERFSELKMADSEKASRESVNERTRKKLSKILTEEQFNKYLSLRLEKQKQKGDFQKENPDFVFSQEDEELDF